MESSAQGHAIRRLLSSTAKSTVLLRTRWAIMVDNPEGGEKGQGLIVMKRRDFIKAGIGGVAALTVAQRVLRAQSISAVLPSATGIIVVGVDGSDLTSQYLKNYLRAGATVWQYSGNTMTFHRFDEIDSFVAANSSEVILAKSYNDILAAKQAGKVAIVAGAQDLYPLELTWNNEKDLSQPPNNWYVNPPQTQLSLYYERGLRIANLAYQFSNFFGGGGLDPATPLSKAGRFIVGQMQEIGILVDCSHSGERTSLDIVKMATRPVVCSHSNPSALNDNPRNVSDSLIEGIAKTGGLIGLNATNCFILWSRADAPYADTGPFPPLASISQYVDMIDYIVRLVGIDYVGIGPDWTIGDPPDHTPPPDPAKSFYFPPEFQYNQPDGLQYVAHFDTVSDLPVLTAELIRHGYSSTDIAKIMGGNWMRVFRQAWNS
jgi:membrane dipeptidase